MTKIICNYQILETLHISPLFEFTSKTMNPFVLSYVSHSFSHIYPFRVIFTNSSSCHNLFPSLSKMFMKIFLITFLFLPLITKPSLEFSFLLSKTLFFNSFEFKVNLTSSIKRVYLPYIVVFIKCL